MEISDSIFALPFGKIGVYGLIRPDFVVWALGSYNLPFARFPKNKEISESILALPPGINYMGSAHICIPRFTSSCLFEFPLWALTEQRFTVLPFISSTFFVLLLISPLGLDGTEKRGLGYSQVRPRHHILLAFQERRTPLGAEARPNWKTRKKTHISDSLWYDE
jgi:hypothetical protein